MKLLSIPKYTLEDFYEDMLEGRHNNPKNSFLKTRLLAIKPFLISEEENYKLLAESKELYSIPRIDAINVPPSIDLEEGTPSSILKDEMEKVYSKFLVDKEDSIKIGRKVYDSILSNTNYNLCPYCAHRDVKTVDHYLPKTKFVSFAVTPYNLLPCCSDCNKDKLDDYNPKEEMMYIHPYFDDISTIDWLDCELNDNIWPLTFSFKVSNDIDDSIIRSRIDYHFTNLKLSRLYSDNATREFRKRVKSIIKEYESNPSNKARNFLEDNFDTYRHENENSWQTKMFRALMCSNWFEEDALPKLKEVYM